MCVYHTEFKLTKNDCIFYMVCIILASKSRIVHIIIINAIQIYTNHILNSKFLYKICIFAIKNFSVNKSLNAFVKLNSSRWFVTESFFSTDFYPTFRVFISRPLHTLTYTKVIKNSIKTFHIFIHEKEKSIILICVCVCV